MPEILDTAPSSVSPLITRRGLTRTVAAMASSGLLVGAGAVGAGSAFAATPSDCLDDDSAGDNTLTAPANNVAEIQALLDADTAIVCLSGTFTLAPGTPLTFDHDLTLYGLTDAVLDGNNATQILAGSANAALTLQNLSFVNGDWGSAGGAVAVDGPLTVENSHFEDNSAAGDGGAIYINAASSDEVYIEGSSFVGNSAGLGQAGGAIYSANDEFNLFIVDSEFALNAAGGGGAVYGLTPFIAYSTFTDNFALFGGAVYGIDVASLASTFADNVAEDLGGAIQALSYAASIDSTFVGNAAGASGGAISGYTYVGSQNSTFVENSAGYVGGAIAAGEGDVLATTFLDNSLDPELVAVPSNAIYIEGEMELLGNIFAGTGASAQLGTGDAPFTDRGGNVFTTAESTEGALNPADESSLFSQSLEAIFGPNPALADNGGPTETVALVAGSPAIDAVPDYELLLSDPLSPVFTAATAELFSSDHGIEQDQRGVDRPGLDDAGAYEYGDAVPELAATGADASTTGWLAGIAALLLGTGAAIALVARLRSRSSR